MKEGFVGGFERIRERVLWGGFGVRVRGLSSEFCCVDWCG